jgi:hypothetical protein
VTGGISPLRSGSIAYRAIGTQARLTFYLSLLARACEIAGQIEEAVIQVDEALQIVEQPGSVGWRRS